ncbi:hypothetical protein [Belliella aquatica]|uniref:Type 1 periplasmic binding fold superfamily protein n=1 Tax=Belliella aquatica TaxID=1323734 RepID=A0ABQ1MYU1_9BACT|nr:hypothetical protein [Belliella aquatica]MCH7406688.1 hypothetical protein [Belliella aquatica]GGC47335.1 hypothetical protein GCM10010993_27450 [Belliella aquatica]
MKINSTIKTTFKAFFFVAILGFNAACNSEDPTLENEEELITDVTLKFTEVDEAGVALASTFEVTAIDSEGLEVGGSPTIGTINLTAGTRYLVEIELFNSIENEDITEEIVEEDDEHQFYFLGSAFVDTPILTYVYDDADGNGNPIGLRGFIRVAEAPIVNNAMFRLVLRHDLNKAFNGANNPNFVDFVNAGGETDLDIMFPVFVN